MVGGAVSWAGATGAQRAMGSSPSPQGKSDPKSNKQKGNECLAIFYSPILLYLVRCISVLMAQGSNYDKGG